MVHLAAGSGKGVTVPVHVTLHAGHFPTGLVVGIVVAVIVVIALIALASSLAGGAAARRRTVVEERGPVGGPPPAGAGTVSRTQVVEDEVV